MNDAAIGLRSHPASVPAGAGHFPTLSWLLLVTMAALLLQIATRLPAMFESSMGVRAEPRAASSAPEPSGLDLEAIAEIGPGAGPAAAPATPVTRAAGAEAPSTEADGPTSAEALDALAAELRRHQSALAERERLIEVREAVVQAVETHVREQVVRLERLKGELAQLLGQVSADQQARIAQLIKVYEAMKAKNAASIFDPMALDLLLPIVRGMRETKVAAIVAEMDPAKARALTAELARARPLPASP